jgi:hypothetical protein
MESLSEYESVIALLLEDIPNWQYTIGTNFAA